MKLFIPPLRTALKLQQDWTFPLHPEYRNMDLWHEFDPSTVYMGKQKGPLPVTIPAGTILTVERIYIRAGLTQFNSLTFSIPKAQYPFKGKPKRLRFWAKLADCNFMDVELLNVAEHA